MRFPHSAPAPLSASASRSRSASASASVPGRIGGALLLAAAGRRRRLRFVSWAFGSVPVPVAVPVPVPVPVRTGQSVRCGACGRLALTPGWRATASGCVRVELRLASPPLSHHENERAQIQQNQKTVIKNASEQLLRTDIVC